MDVVKLSASIMRRFGMAGMYRQEAAIAERPGTVRSTEASPVRFEIIAEGMARGARQPPATARALPHFVASLMGVKRSLRDIDKNPAQPKTQLSARALSELESYAHSLGVAECGYARLPPRLVFKDKAVLYDSAMVLIMEMDKPKIDTAPSPDANLAVVQTYHHLGAAAVKIARYLRKRGYATHAGHPLMGLVLYPPLAQMAGLGWRGRHGMLITPRFGPCCRIAAVFTSIENLPFHNGENEHRWIEGFCRSCGQCIRQCPGQAIPEQPVAHDNGLMTCTDVDKCFPYFMEHFGCSVCIKVCPFNRVGYAKIRASL